MPEPHLLPIHEVLPELKGALGTPGTVVLAAPPGSGKTTVVPLELLDAPWMAGGRILMLEPRRLAARAAAMRMAWLLGEEVGRRVGYRVRFDSRVSDQTRIEVLTEGILTRSLQSDPELQGVALVIFDEFHLRSIHADLGLALVTDVMSGLREDLRLLVMSATLDTAPIADLLDAAVVTGHGRSHPVARHYLERSPGESIARTTASGVRRALGEQDGDVLAFLPGTGEIRETERLLAGSMGPAVVPRPLYGDLSREAQDDAIRPAADGRRRVVLATSIAETSLTIEGIRAVVDSGWSRLPRFDPNSGLTRLETVRVSRAAADQRAGRAGRLGPGVCYRLWTAAQDTRLAPQTPPEILGADLAPLVLELAHWGVMDPAGLAWLDPPPAGAFAQAVDLLKGLEALDGEGRITATGRRMLGRGVHPRLAHMLGRAEAGGALAPAADLAALLTERDVLRRGRGAPPLPVDVEARLQVLAAWRADRGATRARPDVDAAACARVDRAARRLTGAGVGGSMGDGPLSTGALLSLAYPDRIARRRGSGGYRMAGGRGGRLPEGDALAREEFLVIPALDAGHRDGRIFLAAAIDVDTIRACHGDALGREAVVEWDDESGVVNAREEERLDRLVIGERPLETVDEDMRLRAVVAGIRRLGLGCLPWNRDSEAWRQRVRFLRHHQPEGGWPDVGDGALLATLEDWLAPWLQGVSRRDQLKRLDLAAVLGALLDWDRRQRLDALAPTHLQVPSGSRRRLDYGDVMAPVLAVKLQELFGLARTPTVCGGTVIVTLHLLSPAQRPIQVTQDLAGFWERTYPEVRKELKGRYPKHYWPEDPWTGVPTSRLRPSR